ncbi:MULTISPECIES: SDR family NAD(P)-dependent oxidoreductase [unclassified Sphingobium]|uniref:SDR family NAD(P)-dependent oxidoreductase n=1 Tax=unclassified Sphingobium TaxID=2611147 RepID=UPI002224C580|nr:MULTISPECIES: SDR family oxidoreductase [unclassified Sphingobium]MCW2395249.1 NAD(P)-dependent dehydrogenase (short-subunit alcohol dehydrogenase family) [Sphingobium sp. B8D3B]MCW2418763.1 NAD(P)-dependent dehydrogenase (short-subunit alcohol dehydrogenase family) [Sphingobium sp. B8D3C]
MSQQPIAIVIGGSRGIGAAIVQLLAASGYHVVFSYARDAAAAQAVAASVASAGGQAHAVQADSAREADLIALFDEAQALGPIGALVYSAGITGQASPLAEVSAETLERVTAVNLTGAMLAAREAVRRMALSRGGAGGGIVFISSRATAYGSAGEYVWYAASKGGLDSLMTGLAREVGGDGIRVNCVSPGPVATDMLSAERLAAGAARVPMQRAAQADEIAQAVRYLLSPDASFVNGANLAVSGGV